MSVTYADLVEGTRIVLNSVVIPCVIWAFVKSGFLMDLLGMLKIGFMVCTGSLSWALSGGRRKFIIKFVVYGERYEIHIG